MEEFNILRLNIKHAIISFDEWNNKVEQVKSMKEMNASLCFRLLENNPSFVIIIDQNQKVVWLNQSFCDFLGIDRQQAIGKSMEEAKEPCLKQVLTISEHFTICCSNIELCRHTFCL